MIIRKVLIKSAIPTVFPSYPTYAKSKAVHKRSEASTCGGRIAKENECITHQIEKQIKIDSIQVLEDLKQKFSHHKPGLSNYIMHDDTVNECTSFILLDCSSAPKVMSSIKVFADLTFTVYWQDIVTDSVYSSTMQFHNRLWYTFSKSNLP